MPAHAGAHTTFNAERHAQLGCSAMMRKILIRGLFAGLAAGLVAALTAAITGEGPLSQAIAMEATQQAAHGSDAMPEMVSRAIQSTAGLLVGVLIYGVAFGGLFALCFAAVYGRVVPASPKATALWLAAFGFIVVFVVPFAKYPSGPPTVGNPETIVQRTVLYAGMLVISLLAAYIGVRTRAAAAGRMPADIANLAGVATYLLIAGAAGVALPGVHEVPHGFAATTLWSFREATVAIQAAMWTTIGVAFAYSADRVLSAAATTPTSASGHRVQLRS